MDTLGRGYIVITSGNLKVEIMYFDFSLKYICWVHCLVSVLESCSDEIALHLLLSQYQLSMQFLFLVAINSPLSSILRESPLPLFGASAPPPLPHPYNKPPFPLPFSPWTKAMKIFLLVLLFIYFSHDINSMQFLFLVAINSPLSSILRESPLPLFGASAPPPSPPL